MNFIGACLFFCLSFAGAFWLGRLSAKHEQAATATELAMHIPPQLPREPITEEHALAEVERILRETRQ